MRFFFDLVRQNKEGDVRPSLGTGSSRLLEDRHVEVEARWATVFAILVQSDDAMHILIYKRLFPVWRALVPSVK